MDFKMCRWPWKKKKSLNPRADRIAMLVEQIERSREFQRVIHAGIKIGGPVILTVDANAYTYGVVLRGSSPVLDYLLNFAAGERLGLEAELEELVLQVQQDAYRVDSEDHESGAAWYRKNVQGRN